MNTTKRCKDCGLEKSIDEFTYKGKPKYGKCSSCRSIQSVVYQREYFGTKPREPEGSEKVCATCRELKSIDKFEWNRSGVSHRPHCRECVNASKRVAPKQEKNYKVITEKECSLCHEIKPVSEFYRKTDSGAYQAACRSCQNTRYTRASTGKVHPSRVRNSEYVDEYLTNSACVDCGNNDVRVLEFDHIRGQKKYSISYLRNSSMRLQILIDEIEKCNVRCANCHRIRHLSS